MPKCEILAGEKDRNRFCYLYVYHKQSAEMGEPFSFSYCKSSCCYWNEPPSNTWGTHCCWEDLWVAGEEASSTLSPHQFIPELLALELAIYSADGMLLMASKAVLRLRRFGNKSKLILQLFFFHTSYLQCYSNFLASPVCIYCPSALWGMFFTPKTWTCSLLF